MHKSIIPDGAHELWSMMNYADRGLLKARENELRPLGISPMQATIIVIINADDRPTPMGQLARMLWREPHTISETVARMEKLQLVKRVKAKGKKITIGVTLTEKGQEMLALISQIYRDGDVTNRIMSVLSEEERQCFKACLEKLLKQAFNISAPKYEWPFSTRRS